MIMWVTCYTDASYSKRKGGGWAVWLRSDLGRVVREGHCPRYVKNSTHAELAAIFAGILLSVRTWGRSVVGITIYSDSEPAIHPILPDAPPARDPSMRRLQEKILDLAREEKIRLETRWVKAHLPASTSTAAYLNNKCDRLARKARLEK
jgi:ribonuclease HI